MEKSSRRSEFSNCRNFLQIFPFGTFEGDCKAMDSMAEHLGDTPGWMEPGAKQQAKSCLLFPAVSSSLKNGEA